jgi:hypothetical protein
MRSALAKSRRSVARFASIALAIPAIAGCLSMETPQRFIVTSSSSSRVVLIAPDDAKIVVQEFDVPGDGDLAFWRDALRTDFVENRGYTLLSEQAVAHESGREGHEFVFESTIDGSPYRYLVTLHHFDGYFGETVRVAEFLSPKPAFDAHAPNVRKAIAGTSVSMLP